ncbi:matrix metallopeptidase-21-like [Mercenaria mercenaria]|uniref:matrix metallopeptidase-21-like n=1 Tax=Mercenaria mercenaria TaxID=6596 RepID=UPI001E1DB6DF|nr:matrix metallopeptidase-21-like [Mercenaria mercenaria]XP_045190505.1 matrix metallopeptidase-21-like [Mercenaria mercenaria]XP_045190506.1 matrix metallopeptidase-21-like [Mercenaria mercenaria]
MASEWYNPLTAFCLFSVLLGSSLGEKFYQYRDHRDQAMYERHKSSLSVHNKIEAEQQLEKYGYLHCQIRERHRRSLFPDFFSEGGANTRHGTNLEGGNLPPCTSRKIRKAIRLYQKKYDLPETGVLDRRTKKLMSTSRCGNSDEDEPVVSAVSEITDRTSNGEKLGHFTRQNSEANSLQNALGDSFKNRPWKRSASNTKLLNVISGTSRSSSSSLERRKRYLHDYINRLKNEDPTIVKNENKLVNIKKRSVNIMENIINNTMANKASPLDGQKFEKQVIKWRLLESGYSTRIPVEDQRATIDLAFRMWSEVIPLEFVEETSGDIASVDIEVAFGTGAHQNCKRDFDGHGGEIAHSFSTGNMHFDDDEFFKTMRSFTSDGIYLLRVAVHEIGHVLGLMHTNKKYSIMYAIYEKENSGPEFELGWEDRKAVQRVYGVCKGRFNTVFDWIRKNDKGTSFIFNTYFFRGNHYWMYENHANRTRYGDPLYITTEWAGIPDDPDGYAQVFYISGSDVEDDAYFFKDDDVYKYDNENDKLYEGWPKKIRDVFKGKDGGESVPDNIDSVFFDLRDKNLYFFKNDMVYVFDPKVPEESRGCCLRKNKIQDEFPASEGSQTLPDNIDAVYYSHIDESQFFIKDEDVWQNIAFHPRQKHTTNSVKYIGKWFDKWFDICDVTTHSTHLFDFQKGT